MRARTVGAAGEAEAAPPADAPRRTGLAPTAPAATTSVQAPGTTEVGRGAAADGVVAAVAPEPAAVAVADPPVVVDDEVLAAPSSAPPPPGYLPALDGLRAVSVLAVVAYHLEIIRGGFLGVDVFFVISGFLITRLLVAEHDRAGRVDMRAFWGRRFRRLLPALLVALVVVCLLSRVWLPPWRIGAIRTDALAALFYVANWRFIVSGQSYFGSGIVPSPLRHTWSLSIEEQYYVFWPLLVLAAMKASRVSLRRAVALVAAAGTVASATWMAVAALQGRDLSRIYYGTDTRAFALFAGAWLGTVWDPALRQRGTRAQRRNRARWLAAAGTIAFVPVVALFFVGTNSQASFYEGGFQAMAALSVLVVAGVATGRGALAAALSVRPLLWLGRRSYGIYLWSWPVQVFAQEHFDLEGGVLYATVVALAIGLAALSHWLVEEPIRLRRRPAGFPQRAERDDRPPSRLPGFAMPAFAVVGVAAAIFSTGIGAPKAPNYTRVTDQQALDAALGNVTAEDEAAFRRSTTTTLVDHGPPGPLTGARTLVVDPKAQTDPALRLGRPLKVMMAGDSVGWSIGWGLGKDLTPSVKVAERALIGCGLMPPEAKFIVGRHEPEQYPPLCQKAELVEFKGLGNEPDAVLLWVGAWEVYDHEYQGRRYPVGSKRYGKLLQERLQLRIDRYKGIGAVTVMPIVPCFAPNASRLGDERHDPERVAWVNAQIREVAKRNRGWVRLIDPRAELCSPSGKAKPATPTGIPLREDGAHFDPPAATWFWNTWLAGQMGAVWADVPGAVPTTTSTAPGTPGTSTSGTSATSASATSVPGTSAPGTSGSATTAPTTTTQPPGT
ncbi:MAG: acyltransferase family protein [Acidimicrobiales bacterium]